MLAEGFKLVLEVETMVGKRVETEGGGDLKEDEWAKLEVVENVLGSAKKILSSV